MSHSVEKRNIDPEQIQQIWIAFFALFKKLAAAATATGSTGDDDTKPSVFTFSVPFDSLCDQLKNLTNDWIAETTVRKAIDEGFLAIKSASMTNGIVDEQNIESVTAAEINGSEYSGDDIVCLPSDAAARNSNHDGQHDWYCFECHTGASKAALFECQQCWRVYHSACVQAAYNFAVKLERADSQPSSPAVAGGASASAPIRHKKFTCPVCVLSQRYGQYTIGTRKLSQYEFNEILCFAYQRFKAKATQISRSLLRLKETPPFVGSSSNSAESSSASNGTSSSSSFASSSELTTHLALRYLSYKSIDLTDIEAKLDDCGFESISDFLGDCLTFRHMLEVAVVASTEPSARRRIRDTLNRMFDACRYDLKEMLGCVDCYQNSNRPSVDRLWFCRPCDPPHTLVFAKQKGYPFWPAKVINPRIVTDLNACADVDVRFFGANHERSIIDCANIKDINSSLAELCITKANPSLEKALAELRTHREMLETVQKDTRDANDEKRQNCDDDNNEADDNGQCKRIYAKRQIKPSWKMTDSLSGYDSFDANRKRKQAKASAVSAFRSVKKARRTSNRSNTTESEQSQADSDKRSSHNSAESSEHESEDSNLSKLEPDDVKMKESNDNKDKQDDNVKVDSGKVENGDKQEAAKQKEDDEKNENEIKVLKNCSVQRDDDVDDNQIKDDGDNGGCGGGDDDDDDKADDDDDDDDNTSTDVDESMLDDVTQRADIDNEKDDNENDNDNDDEDDNKDDDSHNRPQPAATDGVKRHRGRPRKYFPADPKKGDSNKSVSISPDKRRVRRSKVLYSPQYHHQQNKMATAKQQQQVGVVVAARRLLSPSPTRSASPRGRKPGTSNSRREKAFSPTRKITTTGTGKKRGRLPSPTKTISTITTATSGRSSFSPVITGIATTKSSKVSSSASGIASYRKKLTSDLADTSPRAYQLKKVMERAQRRKQNIERQRKLFQARRKFKREHKEPLAPRHIPPVTATKSAPNFSISASNYHKSIIAPNVPHLSRFSPFGLSQSTMMQPILSPSLPPPLPSANPYFPVGSLANGFRMAMDRSTNENVYKNGGFIADCVPKIQPTQSAITGTTTTADAAPAIFANHSSQISQYPLPIIADAAVESKEPPSVDVLITDETATAKTETEKKIDEGEDSKSNSVNCEVVVGDCGDDAKDYAAETNSTATDNLPKPKLPEPDTQQEQSQPEHQNKEKENNDDAATGDDVYDDDDDDPSYLYDDEQLEEEINDYVAYQREKEMLVNAQRLQMLQMQQQQQLQLQQQQQQWMQQQQPMVHQFPVNRSPLPPNGFANTNHCQYSNSVNNGLIDPPKKYLEFSSADIYSPTKQNRTLVNAYLHQISTKNFTSGAKNDFLAQLILRKDEPIPEPEPLTPVRKRGRPPKGGSPGSEVIERSAKARSIVEKSYLQESACDRACLMKNIKSFKKFRDFVESQNREDINKYKREIEELKQEVYRLRNQKNELDEELTRQRELSKRADPQLVAQLQAKHRKQISEIKRKQWCINCEAEASYFCCFNTNYCSPECQHKHWKTEHKAICTRNIRANHSTTTTTITTPITTTITAIAATTATAIESK